MKTISSCELFQQMKKKDEITEALRGQLSVNLGRITPAHLAPQMADLRIRSRNSQYAFLQDALALFETRGLIRLFNLVNINGGVSKVPGLMPFVIGSVRADDSPNTQSARKDRVVFVNMYHIGNWSADDDTYKGVSAFPDLYSCLETGVIQYLMNVQMKGDAMFDTKSVVEPLEKIYVYLFTKCASMTKLPLASNDFNKDASDFLAARFFLLNVLGKVDSATIDDYAYLAVENRSSITALKNFEEMKNIRYDTLSNFLDSFGRAFFYDEPIFLSEFAINWMRLYGQQTQLAIEYAPYLLHFLFAAYHGAPLGGACSGLTRGRSDLLKRGLAKLYSAVVVALK